jgi:hypothetical protein
MAEALVAHEKSLTPAGDTIGESKHSAAPK